MMLQDMAAIVATVPFDLMSSSAPKSAMAAYLWWERRVLEDYQCSPAHLDPQRYIWPSDLGNFDIQFVEPDIRWRPEKDVSLNMEKCRESATGRKIWYSYHKVY